MFTNANQAIWGAVVGYGLLWGIFHLYRLLTGKEAMGYGDFKLLAALGAWLGLAAVAQVLFVSAMASVIVGVGLVLLRIKKLNQPIAYGPFLALGGIVTVLAGSLIG